MKYREMINYISSSLGIGFHTVRKTISEYNNTKCLTSLNRKRLKLGVLDKIDEFDKTAIRKKIHSFWLNRQLPTMSKILAAINEDTALPNIKETSLRIVLKSLNFIFTKRKRNSVLTERRQLVNWRREYLISIRRFREEGRPIYYLDETWLDTGHDVNNSYYIILHIGSADGFVRDGLLCLESKKNNTDYHNEINGQTFKEWFEEILPLLKENAVVVMDNASYHSVKTEIIPTIYWKKTDIVEWLLSKGEEVDPTIMIKSQLMAIVKRLKPK